MHYQTHLISLSWYIHQNRSPPPLLQDSYDSNTLGRGVKMDLYYIFISHQNSTPWLKKIQFQKMVFGVHLINGWSYENDPSYHHNEYIFIWQFVRYQYWYYLSYISASKFFANIGSYIANLISPESHLIWRWVRQSTSQSFSTKRGLYFRRWEPSNVTSQLNSILSHFLTNL